MRSPWSSPSARRASNTRAAFRPDAGPPEDVGGPPGYADFLQAWHDPLDDQQKDMRRWAGRKFDPERLDLDATNKVITRAIRRSRGNYRFRHEA